MNYNIIHYACVIDTGTTETMESIGLHNGKIKIISDGCQLAPSACFEDDTLVGDNWVNLFKLEGLAQTGTRIDIVTGGDYAYLTGMNVILANQTLDGTMPYHEALQQLQQSWLIGAGIQFFVVCDRERFIQRWEGVIDNIAFTDEDFTFSAVDKLVKKFKQLPQVAGDQIAIGNIKYAPMKLVSKEEETVLLESHTIARILPYGEQYCDGTYAQNAEGWSASMWGSDMDIVGFGVQKQYPSQLAQSAVAYFGQRILTPMNNRDYWIILELSQEQPDWIGKTITIQDNDYLIIDTKLDIIPDSITLTNPVPEPALWVLAKDFDADLTTEALFGVPKSIRYAANCVNVADATAVLDSLKQFSTEKVLCTISNKLKVLQFSKDVSLVDLVTDADGNIIFYTKSADGTMVEVKIDGKIDAENNIVIINETRRREIVTPDRVTVSSSKGMGWQAQFTPDEYEPIYNDPLGFQYSDTTKWSGSDYNLREVYNGKNLSRQINPDIKCIYASSSTDLETGKLNPIKLYMEFDDLDIEQDYKPYIFMQSDYYEGQQWAATYDSAENHHPPVVLPYNSTLDVPDTDPNHQESNNSDSNLWFGNRSPTHDVNSRSIWADVWVCNIYPVIIHGQHGLITASSLDSNFLPVVPYTFDMPKRVGRSDALRLTVENPDFPDDGRYTKMYAYQAVLPYAVTTAPIELLPDNDSIGAEITINYWRAYKDSNYTITSVFTNQPITTGLIRLGNAHSEYIQVATDSGNERQFLLNSIATGATPAINSEVPTISTDDIKIATKEKTTRLLLEIQSEYFIDRAVRYLDPGFNGASNNTALLDISPEFLKIMGLGLMIDEPIAIGDLYVSLKSKAVTVPSDSVYGALHYMTDTYSGLVGDYSSLPTDRALVDPKLWNIGRLIQDQKNTFDYVTELCQQSFVTGWTNRMGDITYAVLSPEFEATDSDNTLVYFTENNIIRDSLSPLSLTPLTQVYNEFDIQFAYNYATGKYDKQYSIKHVDEPEFPPVDASNGKQVANDSSTIIPVSYQSENGTGSILLPTIHFVEDDWKQVFIYNTFDTPGTPLNHAIWGTVTEIIAITPTTTKIRFKMDMDKSIIVDSPDLQLEGAWLSNIYTIGDIWTEYVIGISDYLMAKDVWEQCHAGWLENKTINKAPTNLTDLIWATDLATLDSPIASQYEEYAYNYLMLMAKWATRQKLQVEFDVPVNEPNSKLELMQRVRFHDPVLTPDIVVGNVLTTQYGVGYITSLALVPNEDVIKLGLTFEKFGSRMRTPPQPIVITETGSAITITETGIAITITEA